MSETPTAPLPPDLSIPFERAILVTMARPPIELAHATAEAASQRLIRHVVEAAMLAVGDVGATRNDTVEARATALAFAYWGAVRLSAELAGTASAPPPPTDLMAATFELLFAGYSEIEVKHMAESGLSVFKAMSVNPQLAGLCGALQDVFSYYARTGDDAYLPMASSVLKALHAARRRDRTAG